MRNVPKPPSVLAAQQRSDHKTLSILGRAGGRARHDKSLIRQAQDELAAERASIALYARQVAANEHIIPLSTYD